MKFKMWVESNQFHYIGQCDKLRKSPDGEHNWHNMMATAKPVSVREFLSQVDMSPLLDEGESVEDFLKNMSDVKFYLSSWGNQPAYFMGTKGFEFVFIK